MPVLKGPDFILMDNNACPHGMGHQLIPKQRMDWPARSPDLNPNEHAWDMLQTEISAHPVQPTMVQELQQALLDEWARIPQQSI